jgi:hypothetical protein
MGLGGTRNYLYEQRQAAHPLMLFFELRNTFHEGEAFFRMAVEKARANLSDLGDGSRGD